MSLNITITDDIAEALRAMKGFPQKMLRAVARAMDLENQHTVAHTSERRLTGTGPFPPSENRLGVVTNRLRNSLRATKAEVDGTTVVSEIGSNIKYAAVHEFGFSGPVFVNSHERKSFLRNVVGKKKRKRVAATIVTGHGRNVSIPARAPIGTGIQERAGNYSTAISSAIVQAWEDSKR